MHVSHCPGFPAFPPTHTLFYAAKTGSRGRDGRGGLGCVTSGFKATDKEMKVLWSGEDLISKQCTPGIQEDAQLSLLPSAPPRRSDRAWGFTR